MRSDVTINTNVKRWAGLVAANMGFERSSPRYKTLRRGLEEAWSDLLEKANKQARNEARPALSILNAFERDVFVAVMGNSAIVQDVFRTSKEPRSLIAEAMCYAKLAVEAAKPPKEN